VVTYGTGSYAGVTASRTPGADELFRRVAIGQDTDNCSTDFASTGAVGAELRITSISPIDARVRLVWQDIGRDYVVEYCTNVMAHAWQSVPGTAWPITINTWTSSVPTSAQECFRIKGY
jgi:hypothetical protein